MVKSYNERRGFGFVACAEAAERFGRDVYIAKTEALQVTSEAACHQLGAAASLAEEDFVRFHVRLSAEGFPQAERIQRMRKFQGSVLQPPELAREAASTEEVGFGRVSSDEFRALRGQHEVLIGRKACGQARLAVGDRVVFCVAKGPETREAQLVVLSSRPQQNAGLVLGCFELQLPRAPVAEGWPARADFRLSCHCLEDRVILSGLPSDASEAELMRFFGKQGATSATVAQSQCSAFAAASFPGIGEVARFAARDLHTFSDDKETRLATLTPHSAGASNSRLPGLAAPTLAGGEVQGTLVVTWFPVVLATGYVVEFRPAGMQAPWSIVDPSNGSWGCDTGSRFARDCSSCKVTGLPSNVVFEARVTYFASCGCRADSSDASDWCIACPSAVPRSSTTSSFGRSPCPVPSWLSRSVPQPFQPPRMEAAWAGGGGAFCPAPACSVVGDFCQQLCQQQQAGAVLQPFVQQPSVWPCMHGVINPPPTIPELQLADDAGFAILVRWPAMNHATAYVVELRESGSQRAERFIRSVPMQALGSLVELCIGGLRPAGMPGQCYVAQVRCVAACGCESEPSPPGWSQTLSSGPVPAVSPQQPPGTFQRPPVAAFPPAAGPSAAPSACTLSTAGGPCMTAAMVGCVKPGKLGYQPPQCGGMPRPSSTSPLQDPKDSGEEQRRLPTLLSPSSRLPPPPASGPVPSMLGLQKEVITAVTDMMEEDCIILD